MALCEFSPAGGNDYRCERCAFVARGVTSLPIRRRCPELPLTEEEKRSKPRPCCGDQKGPDVGQKIWNLAKAAAKFIAQPGFVSPEEYSARLAVCDTCPHRDPISDACLKCGCYLTVKAAGKGWGCPEEYWPGQAKHLSIDLAAGVVVQTDRSRSVPYDDEYWDKYCTYEKTDLGRRLLAGRLDLVNKFLERDVHAELMPDSPADRKGPRQPARAGKLLDIGIGSGAFVLAANTLGYDVNPRAKEWLGRLWRWFDPYEEQDLRLLAGVTLWDVLEHLPEPDALLGRMLPGQFLFTSIPIFQDLRRVRESKHYRPDEHYWYFTHEGFLSWMAARGFEALYSDQRETDAGREGIRSYVFKKQGHAEFARRRYAALAQKPQAASVRGHVPAPPAALLTNGLGDFLAVDSMLTDEQRGSIDTLYYATRARRPIQQLIDALPNYRVRHHVSLWDTFGDGSGDRHDEPPFAFSNAEDVARTAPVPSNTVDWSIERMFPNFRYTDSSPLRFKLADVSRFDLPDRYLVCQHDSPNDRRPATRGFAVRDWQALFARLEQTDQVCVLLNVKGSAPTPRHRRLVNLVGRTDLLESIEILKGAAGYVGIDSWLSVLAAKLFVWPQLILRCHRAHAIQFKSVYWAPACKRGPREPSICTWLPGGHVPADGGQQSEN